MSHWHLHALAHDTHDYTRVQIIDSASRWLHNQNKLTSKGREGSDHGLHTFYLHDLYLPNPLQTFLMMILSSH